MNDEIVIDGVTYVKKPELPEPIVVQTVFELPGYTTNDTVSFAYPTCVVIMDNVRIEKVILKNEGAQELARLIRKHRPTLETKSEAQEWV